jgi:hypothetical protein
MSSHKYKHAKAFSLVELAIVILIIGLLISGTIGAKNLVIQAKYRGLMRQVGDVKAAMMIFETGHDALPGDFAGAGILWGAKCGGNSAAPAGCNGNEDGKIQDLRLSKKTVGSTNVAVESFRFWQHLSLAEILGIGSQYDGKIPAAEYNSSRSSNPKTKMGEDVFISVETDSGVPPGYKVSTNFLRIAKAAILPNNSYVPQAGGGIFSPYEAYMFDTKFDDGKGNTGAILAWGDNDSYGGAKTSPCLSPTGSAIPPPFDKYALNSDGVVISDSKNCHLTFNI